MLQGCGLAGDGALCKRDLVPACSEGAAALPAFSAFMIWASSQARSLLLPQRHVGRERRRSHKDISGGRRETPPHLPQPGPTGPPCTSPCPSTAPSAVRGPGDAQWQQRGGGAGAGRAEAGAVLGGGGCSTAAGSAAPQCPPARVRACSAGRSAPCPRECRAAGERSAGP